MLAHVTDNLACAREQPGIIKNRLADSDAVLTELSSLSELPSCLCQCPHGNGSVIRRHATNRCAGDKNRSSTQLCGPECGRQTCWTGANDYDFHHAPRIKLATSAMWAACRPLPVSME